MDFDEQLRTKVKPGLRTRLFLILHSRTINLSDMEESEVSPEYQKRFNDGYLIAKHMPELATTLRDAAKTLDDGFRDGIEQFAIEQQKGNYPAWMKKDRLSGLDKEEEQDKGKDEKELE